MADEIEVKMKVADLGAVRDRLRTVGATRVGERFEVNAFYDRADRTLKNAGNGLRLRTMTATDGTQTAVVTFKGPRRGERVEVSNREEIEFAIGDFEAAGVLLERLGYGPILSFEKRRETWSLDGCLVELDEMPILGTFVEIEGDDEATIVQVRVKLGLEFEPMLTKGYASMIGSLLAADPKLGPNVRFS